MIQANKFYDYQRVALVTGANRGIGLAICRQLAEHGIAVFLGARSETTADSAVQDFRQRELDVRFEEVQPSAEASATARFLDEYLSYWLAQARNFSSGFHREMENSRKLRRTLRNMLRQQERTGLSGLSPTQSDSECS